MFKYQATFSAELVTKWSVGQHAVKLLPKRRKARQLTSQQQPDGKDFA